MRKLFHWLHAAFHEPSTQAYRGVQGTVWGLIVASIVLLIVEALLPEGSRLEPWIRQIDRVFLSIFVVELLIRVGTYYPPSLKVFHPPRFGRLREHLRARLLFMIRPMMMIDVLAVLAFFPELRGLRALRLLRLLRTSRVFRYRNPFAIVLRALEENGLLFAFAFSVLGTTTILGGVSIFLVENRINPTINNVGDGIWWSLVTVTTVGFGDISPVTSLGRIIGGALMIGGMFTLALFAGIVGSSLVSGIVSIREEQFRMSDYVNHVVVCGHDESTPLLLDALTREIDLDETRVVLVDDHERPRDLPPAFIWVQGDPTKESEMDKLRVAQASAVVVSGSREITPQQADARTLLTVFTIRSFLAKNADAVKRRRCPLYVLAEILDAENVDHARAAGADEVIETRKIGYSMMAHAIGNHGTATTVSNVLINTAQNNFYIGKLPPDIRFPTTLGEILVKMRLSDRGGLVIGIREQDGTEELNPPKSKVVTQGTTLIYLADEALLEPPD